MEQGTENKNFNLSETVYSTMISDTWCWNSYSLFPAPFIGRSPYIIAYVTCTIEKKHSDASDLHCRMQLLGTFRDKRGAHTLKDEWIPVIDYV